MDFNVYVIYSPKLLSELKNHLDECGGYIHAGIIYRSINRYRGRGYTFDKEETKKTVVFCKEETIVKLEENPTYKGKVLPYNWTSFPVPNDQHNECWDLHISGIPNDYTSQEAEKIISDSIKSILPMKEGNRTNYKIEFSPRSRETGEIRGYGHIIFDNVNKETIKLCKLILHNMPVPFKNEPDQKRIVTCVWHRLGAPNRKAKTGDKKYNLEASNMRRMKPMVKQVDISNVSFQKSEEPVTSSSN